MQEAVRLLPIPVSSTPRPDPKLTRIIAVAGSVAAPDDFVNLWRGLSSVESERFALVWETQELIDLTNSIMDMLLNQASGLIAFGGSNSQKAVGRLLFACDFESDFLSSGASRDCQEYAVSFLNFLLTAKQAPEEVSKSFVRELCTS